MADTNTYISKQKVEKWTTKEKFIALDLSDIPVGTEYNLTGAIEESDLDVDLQTKINEVSNKLTAPTIPTAESAVTMLADGTVGTKPISEIGGGGGGKLYRHMLRISVPDYNSDFIFYVYNKSNTKLTFNDIKDNYFLASVSGNEVSGVVSCIVNYNSTESIYVFSPKGVVISNTNQPYVLKYVIEDYVGSMGLTDTVTEL